MVRSMTIEPDDKDVKAVPSPVPDKRVLITAVVLMCLAFALLPVWDGISQFRMLSALAGSGLGRNEPVPVPVSMVAYPIAAIALGWTIVRKATSSPRWAQVLFYIGAALGIVYALTTAVETAVTRSHAIDSWLVCETQQYPGGGAGYVSRFQRKPAFDGPHLPNGDPCTMAAEDRYAHRKEYPDGNVADGLVQIWKRFPKDRARVIGGSVLVMVAAALGTVMMRKAHGAGRG